MWTWYLCLPPTLAGSSESVTEPLLKETVRANLALAASCSEYLPKDVFHSQQFIYFFSSDPLGYLHGITLMSELDCEITSCLCSFRREMQGFTKQKA